MRFPILITTLLLSAQLTGMAQTSVSGHNPVGSGFKSSVRTWDQGPLEWSEFLGRPKTDTTAFEFHWVFRTDVAKERHGRTTYRYLSFKPYLDMTESWSRPELQNPTSLKVCQAAFDMLELYGRRATRDYAFNTESDAHDIVRYYNNQYQHKLDDMFYSTRKGQDPAQADLQATAIQMELEAEHFDPTQVPLGQPQGYFGISMGYSMMAPLSDYFDADPFGLGLTIDFGYHRHLWMLDMAVCFGGQSQKTFPARDGYFYEGDDVNCGMMMLNWGYRVGNDPRRLCYPYIGLGAIFFDDITAGYYRDNGKKITPEKAGFAMGAGFIYDLPIHRTVSLCESFDSFSGTISRQNISQHSLRIKPSINLCHLSDIGWTPCLNLCISYDLSSINLR